METEKNKVIITLILLVIAGLTLLFYGCDKKLEYQRFVEPERNITEYCNDIGTGDGYIQSECSAYQDRKVECEKINNNKMRCDSELEMGRQNIINTMN